MTESARIKLAKDKKILYNSCMKIGIFGGSFDPVHTEHVRYVAAAKRELGLDTVIVVPSYVEIGRAHV